MTEMRHIIVLTLCVHVCVHVYTHTANTIEALYHYEFFKSSKK